jgi:translation initiation factor IF-2
MTVSSKVRIYDLAKELKLDTKRLIEEVRREGVDVSVPSNSVSKELAEKIRNKYFPKKETTVKRAVKVVKRAALPTPEAPMLEEEPEVHEPEPDAPAPPAIEPVETPSVEAPPPAKQPIPARLVKKLTPAVRAEAPVPAEVAEAPVVEAEPIPETPPPVVHEPIAAAPVETSVPTNGVEVKTPPPAPPPPRFPYGEFTPDPGP